MDDKKLLQRLINQVAKDKNADPTQVKDFLARVVALESGRSFDPTIKQKTEKGVGPGRGLSQIEVNGKGGSNRIVSTIGRAINYYNSKNEEIPEFISDIKDEIYTNGTFDVSTISKEKQLLLTLADFRMGNGDLGKVFSGEIDTSDMWLDHWWQGKDSEREKKLKYYHDTMSSYDQNEFFSNLYDEDLDSNKEEFKFENIKSSGSDTLDAFANSSASENNFNDLLNSIKQKTPYNNDIQSYDKLQFTEQDFEKSLKDSQNASATEGDEFNIKPVENTFNQGGNINKNFNFRTKQINSFNEGGLHSENSLGGIPQGVGKNGKPNLVEEGESSYTFKDGSKFIFSHKGLGQKNSNSNTFNKGGNLNEPGDKDKNKKNDPPTEVKYGTPEYEQAYKEGRIQGQELDEVVVTADKRTGKNILEDYPFYNKLSEQDKKYFRDSSPIGSQIRARARDGQGVTEDKASAMGSQLLQGAMSATQIPQSAMVEGVEAMRGNKYDFKSTLPGNKQRVPSDAWGYENPEGFWQNAANIGMDVVADPENIVGAGFIKSGLQQGAKKGLTSSAKQKSIDALEEAIKASKKATSSVDDVGKGFKSEIDWENWLKTHNKDWDAEDIKNININKKEYDVIEQTSKANGTWMKNSDGSKFTGTPEQFIQQISKNFKKYTEHVKKVYHGTPTKGITEFNATKGERLISGDKYPDLNFTSTNKNIAKEYAGKEGEVLELYASLGKNKSIDYGNTSWTGQKPEYIIMSKNTEGMQYDAFGEIAMGNKLKKFKTKEAAEKYLKKELKDAPYSKDMGVQESTFIDLHASENSPLTTNKLATRYKNQGFDSFTAKNVRDSYDGSATNMLNDIGDDVVIFNGNRLKSATGNSGMFDITNPNIFKSLLPAAIGTGAAMQNTTDKPQQFQDGGKLNTSGCGGPGEPPCNEVKEMTKSYIKSPKYKERLKSSGYDNIDKEIKYRLNNINNTETIYQNGIPSLLEQIKLKFQNIPYSESGSIYDKNNKKVIIDKKQSKNEKVPIKSIEAHEYAHSELDPNKENYDYRNIGIKNTRLNTYDNLNLKHRIKKEIYEKNSHNSFPDENKADLNAFRYELKDLYDASTEDFTKEHLKKSKNSTIKKRLLKNYSEEDLIWLMNNIASTNNINNNTKLT